MVSTADEQMDRQTERQTHTQTADKHTEPPSTVLVYRLNRKFKRKIYFIFIHWPGSGQLHVNFTIFGGSLHELS